MTAVKFLTHFFNGVYLVLHNCRASCKAIIIISVQNTSYIFCTILKHLTPGLIMFSNLNNLKL